MLIDDTGLISGHFGAKAGMRVAHRKVAGMNAALATTRTGAESGQSGIARQADGQMPEALTLQDRLDLQLFVAAAIVAVKDALDRGDLSQGQVFDVVGRQVKTAQRIVNRAGQHVEFRLHGGDGRRERRKADRGGGGKSNDFAGHFDILFPWFQTPPDGGNQSLEPLGSNWKTRILSRKIHNKCVWVILM